MSSWKSISNNNYKQSNSVKIKNSNSCEINNECLNTVNMIISKKNLDVNNKKIINLSPGTNPTDAVTYNQLTKLGDGYMLKSGDEMNGILDMCLNKIINLSPGTNPTDAVTYNQLTKLGDGYMLKSGDEMNGILDMSLNKIINLTPGTNPTDAVNCNQLNVKSDISYVDMRNLIKADISYVDMRNSIKADISYVDMKTSVKADISYVDMKNALKADISYVDMKNALKSDISFVKINFVDLFSNQYIEGDKTFSNKVIFENQIKTNLLATDIPNSGTRCWLDSSGTQIIDGDKIFSNISIVNNSGNNSLLTLDTGNGSFKRIACQRFFTTFYNTIYPDYKSRRTADITAGYNSKSYIGEQTNGNWGSEYLTFNVGNNGLSNDSDDLTDEKMRITSRGNIGIGIKTPMEKLHVNGNTKINGMMKLEQNNVDSNSKKILNIANNNNELWFNPCISNKIWNSLICQQDKGIIFSDGNIGTGNLVIGNWGDAGLKIIGETGNIGISESKPSNKLTITENASNIRQINMSASKIIKIKNSSIIYDVYNLNNGYFTFEIPSIEQDDNSMVNKVIYFNIENNCEVSLVPLNELTSTNIVNINENNYISEPFIKNTSFVLIGTPIVGYYTIKPYKKINEIDQLCLKTNLGTNSNNEFAGIRFYGTNIDMGFIRVDTDREHKDSNMNFLVRQQNNIIKPLIINNYINAYRPIIRNEWTSGELINTQIFNENNCETGVLQIKGTTQNTISNWKNLTYKFKNKNVKESIIEIMIEAPYFIENFNNEDDIIEIIVYDDTTNIRQEIINKKILYNNPSFMCNNLFPLITTYTPSYNLTQFNRNIKIDFINKSENANFMICFEKNKKNNNFEIKNKWLIKITEYKL